MKKISRYTAVFIVALIAGSCSDDEKFPVPDFTKSSVPVFQQRDNDTGFINFQNLNATTLAFDVSSDGSEEVSAVDVIVTFNNRETGKSEAATHSTVTTFPGTIDLTIDELLALFPSTVVTRDTLGLGDSFVIGGNVLLADGRYLSGGYSPSVVANNPVFLTYNVACESDLGGAYDFTLVSGNSGEKNSIPDQTITEIGAGYYELSDVSMDLFGDTPIRYRFTDICGNLIADGGSVDFGTAATVRFNPGTGIDPATGVITFSVEYIPPSCCGLPGIKTVFKASPK